MLLPEDDPNATHIMIATGTGVAPFRGYLRRMFMESVPTYKFGGLAWLFLGVANSDSLLYDEEFKKYLKDYPSYFRLVFEYQIGLACPMGYIRTREQKHVHSQRHLKNGRHQNPERVGGTRNFNN